MLTIIAKQGQSFMDIVNEATGDIGNLFEMALANNVSITHTPEIGAAYIIAGKVKKSITDLFGNGKAPATLFTATDAPNDNVSYGFPGTFPFL